MGEDRSGQPVISQLNVDGQRYDVDVPGTLDLADRARHAINVLTRTVIPERWYSIWQNMRIDSNPPHFSWPNFMTYKYLEALPRMREMCGDRLNLDVEQAMMEALVGRIGAHGLLYYPPISPCNPPNTALAMACARFILAMAAWHDRDGDPAWLDLITEMAHGLDRMAIRHYDYAFYPSESGFSPEGQWAFRQSDDEGPTYFPYTPPDEPAREQQGKEGSIKSDMGNVLRGLMRAYGLTGDEQTLDLARQLAAYCLLPTMWEDGWQWGILGHEHGLWAGHFHGQVLAFRGLLDLAVATGDEQLKGMVREAYEHGRAMGLPLVGWFPAYSVPERFGRPGAWATINEPCGLCDILALAVSLSDAGVGDYWDDVDHFTRNQLVEEQFVDIDRMRAIAEQARAAKPAQDLTNPIWAPAELNISDNVVERTLGGFSEATPSAIGPVLGVAAFGCCTGNGTMALYYAWEGIVRYRDGTATVNLPLNRASPWVDVDSYLPYEGLIRVTNKTASSVAVRIPRWVNISNVQFSVDGASARPSRVGRYLAVDGLKPGQVLDLAFDVPRSSAGYTVHGQRFVFDFRGSTVVDVSPREDSPLYYPIYQRDHLKSDNTPMRRVTRYVPTMRTPDRSQSHT